MLRRVLFVTVAALIATPALATTIYVNGTTGDDAWTGLCAEWDGGICGPKATIQAGLNSAQTGDDVQVAPGTYPEAINFLGRAVNLHSAAGPDVTTIDATGLDTSVVICTSGEGPETVLAGFTITGGTGTMAPTPVWVPAGGGMYIIASNATVKNCEFWENTAGNGGALALFDSDVVIQDCSFGWNWSWWHGGAIYEENSSPEITGCTFYQNSAGYGGALAGQYGEPVVVGCVFAGNSAGGHGGAVDLAVAGKFSDCVFSGNYAGHAGALYALGGAILAEEELLQLVNCTFSGNSLFGQDVSGGALHVGILGDAALEGCIVWGNWPDEVFGEATVSYSDMRGGWAGEGNIDSDPLFLQNPSPGADGFWGSEDDDYGDLRLAAGSSGIDAGDPGFVPAAGQIDLDGRKRVWDGDGDETPIVDMGAYEFGSHRYGDLNCDELLNVFDIDPFALALTEPDAYAAAFPNCSQLLADVNADGLVNAFDIDPLVTILVGGD